MAGLVGPGGNLYGALHVKHSSLAPRFDGSLYAARTSGDAGVTVGGELAIGGADIAPRTCIRRVPRDPDHDAAMRIGGEAPGRRVHTHMRPASHILGRVTATSDHPRQPASVTSTGAENHRRYRLVARCSRHRTENDAFRRLTARYQAPKGDEQLARQGHDHGLACAPPAVRRPRPVPLRQGAFLLKEQEAPG